MLVMPIVFGGAVSVTALVSAIRLHGHTTISPALWVGMVLTVVGVVIVATNTPHAHAAPPPKSDAGASVVDPSVPEQASAGSPDPGSAHS